MPTATRTMRVMTPTFRQAFIRTGYSVQRPTLTSQRLELADFLGGLLCFDVEEGLRSELVGLAEFREEGAPDAGDHHGADAAVDDGADGSPPLGGEAAFKFAEFVGTSEEKRVDGGDTAAHFRRSGELEDGGADDDADHIGRSHDEEREHGPGHAFGNAEEDGGEAEDSNADKHEHTGTVPNGPPCEIDGDDEGSGVEDIFGKDRHEGDGSAEQDGEEVKRDGAEQDRSAANVAEAREDDIHG